MRADRGGRYVDVAIMAPVRPKRHRVPLLLAAADAEEAAARLFARDMRPAVAGSAVGDASTVKMLRPVSVKGIEPLKAECMPAAHEAGAAKAVFGPGHAADRG